MNSDESTDKDLVLKNLLNRLSKEVLIEHLLKFYTMRISGLVSTLENYKELHKGVSESIILSEFGEEGLLAHKDILDNYKV